LLRRTMRAPPQVGLEFIERRLYFPPLVIEGGQFSRWSLFGVQDGCQKPIEGFRVRNALKDVFDDPDGNTVTAMAPVLGRGVDRGEVGAVIEVVLTGKMMVLLGS